MSIDYPGPAEECAGGCGADMSVDACPNVKTECVDCCGCDHEDPSWAIYRGEFGTTGD